jgi:NAD(P)-dependent dehydrogenase (short-subunit alcohol dehydrogenase family)
MAVVLITGTSTGIGMATALAFGRAGHRVAATMRNPGKAPALGEAAEREHLPITVFPMDVDVDASVRDGVARIGRDLGPIDVLVNNAGIERMGSVEELPLEEFRAVMETNYFGVIRCVQAVLPAMRARRNGCIINVGSVAGHVAVAPMAAYTASKYALESLSECLAQEVRTFNIRVAIVEPGIIDTAMARSIGTQRAPSPYPQQRRVASLFATALRTPVPPPGGCRQDPRNRRRGNRAAASPRGTGRRSLSRLASKHERRGLGRAWGARRRGVVRPHRSRLRDGRAPGLNDAGAFVERRQQDRGEVDRTDPMLTSG